MNNNNFQRMTEHGFGFNDGHERTPVTWFQYPDDDEPEDGFIEDAIRDTPMTTREGGLRQKRTNGAAISRPVFPVNDPDTAARFVQFLIDHNYAPGATAALFITIGIERRFNYRVAEEVGVTNRSLMHWLAKARWALTSKTVPVPPIDLPDEQEPKPNPRATDYWNKTKNVRVGGDIRDAVKTSLRDMLEHEPHLSDATLARRLTELAKVAISRRTVAKYRAALGIRRQGELKEALAEALANSPHLSDAELADLLTETTRTPVSTRTVATTRLSLGIRRNRKRHHRRSI